MFLFIRIALPQQMSVLGLIVGIPVAFLLTAIISTLIALLIIFQCLTRRRKSRLKSSSTPTELEPLFNSKSVSELSHKSPSPEPEPAHDSSRKSTPDPQLVQDPVYDYIPVFGIGATETKMESNVAYGSSPVDYGSNYD